MRFRTIHNMAVFEQETSVLSDVHVFTLNRSAAEGNHGLACKI